MGKLVVLKLEGDPEQGFKAILELGLEGQRATTEVQGQLPKAPELMVCLKRWQQYYYSSGITPRIKSKQIISGRLGNPWIDECRRLSQELRDRFTIWLKAESFRAISDCLREKLSTRDSIRILIRTSNSDLRRLPWHEWDLLQSYNNAEIAFSPMTYDAFEDETIASTPPPLNKQKVKILAILGHSEGINIERDRQLLAALPDAEVEFLVEPDRAEIGDRLWEQPWDILFFAGHSHTEGNQGRIFINSEDSLTLSELKYALQQAIRNGLQLAIFNSCDGLGLAEELEQLHLPQMIVMREPIPDAMAQAFLQDFLKFFAQGQSLYLAERWAREKLHPLENVVPCASWLPVICQNNLSVLPPNWESLRTGQPTHLELTDGLTSGSQAKRDRPIPHKIQTLWVGVMISLLVAGLLVGVRSLGLMQGLELQAFDHLMRLRSPEAPDDRILLISVSEADIQYQDQMGMARQGSLSDVALRQLLQKLNPHQPQAIGLDIFHDFPFAPDLRDLQQKQPFISPCSMGDEAFPGISPPPEVPPEQIGFVDAPVDPDGAIRRQLLTMPSLPSCSTDQSLSLRLALAYLEQPLSLNSTHEPLRIANVVLQPLVHNAGGYQLPADDASGNQLLINYRAAEMPTLTLKEILSGAADAQLANLVRDRVVLIGKFDPNADAHLTPYSQPNWAKKMPGVMIQAHMISQLLSAVRDRRPLLWWFPEWVEALWIGIWSVLGGIWVWGCKSPWMLGMAIALSLMVLYGLCLLILGAGGWVPFIPAALGLMLASMAGLIYTRQVNVYRH